MSGENAKRVSSLFWPAAAWCLAAVGVAGSLYLSIAMGLKACPLCFYQRTFVMSTLAVLTIGLIADSSRCGLVCLLALAPACGALGIAAFHEYLVLSNILECPSGVLGIGSAPAQSLTLEILLTVTAAIAAWTHRFAGPGRTVWLVINAVVVGLLLAYGCKVSAPPLPAAKPPAAEPRPPLDTCQPVWHGNKS